MFNFISVPFHLYRRTSHETELGWEYGLFGLSKGSNLNVILLKICKKMSLRVFKTSGMKKRKFYFETYTQNTYSKNYSEQTKLVLVKKRYMKQET